MKNKKIMIMAAAILLIALCGFLFFNVWNKAADADSSGHGGLQLGIPEEKKEESSDKEDQSASPSKPDDPSSQDDGSDSSTDPTNEGNDIPEGGQVVDNGDGSVDVVLNEDEATYGL